MRRAWRSMAVAGVFGTVLATTAAADDSCVDCHRALEGALAAPVAAMARDLHAAGGISCSDCHGGDPGEASLAAMDEAKGFRGTPATAEIPGFCARCHADQTYMRQHAPSLPTDQLALYATSVHGQRLASGDERVATCVDCHGTHGMLPPANAASPVYPANVARTCAQCHADPTRMAAYRIPTNQFADYQKSVHAELLFARHDLGAPTCNDCHGNHGAYPPGASSVAAVCGQCHVVNRDLFVASPHKPAFDRLGLPECVTCHGQHAILPTNDAMLGVGPQAVCITCHADGTPQHQAAAAMATGVVGLAAEVERARRDIEAASRAGMEMSDARFELQAAHESLVQSRNLVHAFAPARLLAETANGQRHAEAARATAATALAQFNRRRLLFLVPIAGFLVVFGLLYLKLRDVERRG